MTTFLKHGSRSSGAVLIALTVAIASACREQRPPAPVLPALGPGPIVNVAVPGATALEPVIASQPPLVAVAFATRDSRGPMIYLTTSDDNGATFSDPQPLAAPKPASRYDDLRLNFVSVDATSSADRPTLKLEWQAANGEVQYQTSQPWSRSAVATAAESPKPAPASAVVHVSCSPNGEASMSGAGASVPINHSISDEACVPGEVAAVTDSRRSVHAAWIGRSQESTDPRVFYASSSHGNGFGFSQVLANNPSSASHLRVVTDPNETVVTVWDQEGEGHREVWLRQVIPSHFGPGTLLPLTRLSGNDGGEAPVLASIRGGIIAAWTLPKTGAVAIRRVGLDALCAEPPAAQADDPSSSALTIPANEAAPAGISTLSTRKN